MKQHDSLKDVLAERLQLLTFNPVALELQHLVENPDINDAQLSAAVTRDPALVAQVSRLANASRYARLSKTSTIEQALPRLGTNQVCRLATAATRFSLYKSKNRVLGSHMTNAWNLAELYCNLAELEVALEESMELQAA